MMVIREHPKAQEEVRNHFDHYWEQSVSAAENFMAAYKEALEAIKKYPTINPIAVPGKRWRRFKNFPHKVIFEFDSEAVYVVAVMHAKQKPLYWSERKFD